MQAENGQLVPKCPKRFGSSSGGLGVCEVHWHCFVLAASTQGVLGWLLPISALVHSSLEQANLELPTDLSPRVLTSGSIHVTTTEWFVLEGTLNLIPFPPPAMARDTFHQSRVLQALSDLALDIPRDVLLSIPQLSWET
ncbi:hypothetical protein TURU_112903 [Turdus rufiventris]|nr:hypothetical protein TURU_112903 [Turdus rufiventris]